MKFSVLIVLIILSYSVSVYSGDKDLSVPIDTSRFTLKFSNGIFFLIDNLQKDTSIIKYNFLINQEEEIEDEKTYFSSYNYSGKTNSFEIGKGLVGIQICSYDFMKEGSAQVGAGKDLFFIYDPDKKYISDNILDFGITKQRQRYLGCLSAKTSHFILADIDKNGLIDIGRIQEELKCDESFKTFFIQDSVEWYMYADISWTLSSLKIQSTNYVDLPLIDIKLNPVDVFSFIKWQSYNPKDWDRKSEVIFYPSYRLQLIQSHKSQN